MRTGRLLRLLLFVLLPASLGLAGWGHPANSEARFPHTVGPRISEPTQSLPTPVHDEATCAFCQAAIFPPCTPCRVSVPAAFLETVKERIVSLDARLPHTKARRLAESRAPPSLRID